MSDGNGNTALQTVSDYDGLVMAVAPVEALRRVQELQAFVETVMKSGIDYGTIPGTGNKPCLFQPGAQKLAEIYGFAVAFEDTGSTIDWREPFFFFRKRCVLTSRRDGRFVCDGIGSCNSREDRYAWRWAWGREVPKGMDKSTLRTRGRGDSMQYRVPNEDVYSLVNTLEKMACKRALIHAVTNATRSSGIFTQDVEDLPREAFGAAKERRSWEVDEVADDPPYDKDAADEAAARVFDEPAERTVDELTVAILRCRTEPDLEALVSEIKRMSKKDRAILKPLWAAQRDMIRNGTLPDPEPEPAQPPMEKPASMDAPQE